MPKTVRQIMKILTKNGFVEKGQRGSHIKMYNKETNKTAIVPNHKGDVKLGTEKSIWKQAGLK